MLFVQVALLMTKVSDVQTMIVYSILNFLAYIDDEQRECFNMVPIRKGIEWFNYIDSLHQAECHIIAQTQ